MTWSNPDSIDFEFSSWIPNSKQVTGWMKAVAAVLPGTKYIQFGIRNCGHDGGDSEAAEEDDEEFFRQGEVIKDDSGEISIELGLSSGQEWAEEKAENIDMRLDRRMHEIWYQ